LYCSSFWQWGARTAPSISSTVLPQAKSSLQPVLLASNAGEIPVKSSDKPVDAIDDEYKDDQNLDYANDTFKEEKVEIADPLEPFNRAMHQFNDKLYFWALKPVAQGYKIAVPEPARISVKNSFPTSDFPPVSSVACFRLISEAPPRNSAVLQ